MAERREIVSEYKEDEILSEAWRCYENAIAYQGKIKLRENLPKFMKGGNGRHRPS